MIDSNTKMETFYTPRIMITQPVKGIGRRIYGKGKVFTTWGSQKLNDDGTFTVSVGWGRTVILPKESFKQV